MIQRVQSIFMLDSALLSFILSGFIYFYPIDFVVQQTNISIEIILLCIFSGFVSITSMVMFKNRKLQISLNQVVIALNFALIVLCLYHLLTVSGGSFDLEKGILVLVFFFVVVSSVMANRYIKKDENLVKSVDRIR